MASFAGFIVHPPDPSEPSSQSSQGDMYLLSSLVNGLLGAAQLPLLPSHMAAVNSPARQRNDRQFELKDGADVFSPKDLIQLPRPGAGIVNPEKEDLVLVSVSQYSFETKKWIRPNCLSSMLW